MAGRIVDPQTGEIQKVAFTSYEAPPVRSADWVKELQRASEECEILLWGMVQAGRFKDADEAMIAVQAHSFARKLNKLASDKLSQVGYGT